MNVDTKEKKATIYYNPENPTEIKGESDMRPIYIMLIVGILCIIGYVLYLIFK